MACYRQDCTAGEDAEVLVQPERESEGVAETPPPLNLIIYDFMPDVKESLLGDAVDSVADYFVSHSGDSVGTYFILSNHFSQKKY